ncbi:jg8991 [Pararge aegeria aegeria]|uniref:Jg8991 protein n=1 Tax=Pararge aegeria aegeria TaxID=348720 RepID=A0A8S4SQ53_9NEOP|nr:jg8991 [Pararge aegeria aegeria]
MGRRRGYVELLLIKTPWCSYSPFNDALGPVSSVRGVLELQHASQLKNRSVGDRQPRFHHPQVFRRSKSSGREMHAPGLSLHTANAANFLSPTPPISSIPRRAFHLLEIGDCSLRNW